MTITSSGQLICGNVASNGDFVLGSFTMSGAVLLGSETPTYIYPIISLNEENEMFQIVGTSKIHPVQLRSLVSPYGPATELTGTVTITVKRYTNSGTVVQTTETWTLSAYDWTFTLYELTIPSTAATTAYEGLAINISDEGNNEGFLYVNIVPDPDTFATASALSTVDTVVEGIQTDITAIKGPTWSDETLVTIQAAAETGGTSTGGGSESVIPAAYYQVDASENTITLLTPYNTVTVEQVISIFNLSTGSEVYNCLNPRKRRMYMDDPADQVGIDITIGSGGVITYIEDSSMTDDDKIMILVNIA